MKKKIIPIGFFTGIAVYLLGLVLLPIYFNDAVALIMGIGSFMTVIFGIAWIVRGVKTWRKMKRELKQLQSKENSMQYTRTFKEAVALSCEQGCPLWADTEGTIFDIDTIVEFSEIADQAHPLGDWHLYAVSAEGAIGLCNGKEYDIDWMFYPVEDEAVKEQYRAQYRRDLEERRAAASGNADMKFCLYCGKQIPRSAKFCSYCGGNQEE